LDKGVVSEQFIQLAQEVEIVTRNHRTPEQVAEGFISIAVESMANAIKKISLQRGYDVTNDALCCFGGAGAQVACLIADTLGMKRIFLHPYAGVLSAYGMGLADVRAIREAGVEKILDDGLLVDLQQLMEGLEVQSRNELEIQGGVEEKVVAKINLKYEGTNSILGVGFDVNVGLMRKEFEKEHHLRYGFVQGEKNLIVESVSVEVIQKMDTPEEALIKPTRELNQFPVPVETVRMFTHDQWYSAPVYRREDLQPGDIIQGAAIIVEKISTIVVEPSWEAELTERNHLQLSANGEQ